MTQRALAVVPDAFDAPVVNRAQKDRVSLKVVPDEPTRDVWAGVVTAGTSGALEERDTALNRYVLDTTVHPYFTTEVVPSTMAEGYEYFTTEANLSEASQAKLHVGDALLGGAKYFVSSSTLTASEPWIYGGGLTGSTIVWPAMQWPTFVNADPVEAYAVARRAEVESREAALADIRRRLDVAAAEFLRQSPQEVVTHLIAVLGFGQLLVAKSLEVSPTAVRKWRRGETLTAAHRQKLAQLAALGALLTEVDVHDPAGWVDIPISSEATITPLNLFMSGRGDLAVLAGARLSEPEETLAAFDPNWRETAAADTHHRLMKLSDGSEAIVPR